MSDIFISYSSEDRERVLPLVHALEKMGWSVFWDRTIPAGKTWWQFIDAEIQSCRSVVVVWTENSITSTWVYEEADAGKRKRILIPVLFDNVEPPFGFGGIQAANLTAWNGDSSSPTFTRLVADIAIILGPVPAGVKEAEDRRSLEAEAQRKAGEGCLRERERQRPEEQAKLKADEESQRSIEGERNRAQQEATQRFIEAEAQHRKDEPRRKPQQIEKPIEARELLEFRPFTKTQPANQLTGIVGITVKNRSNQRLEHCSVRIDKIEASNPDSIYWIFSDSKLRLPLPKEEFFALNPYDWRDVSIAQLDEINSRFENLGIELLCYSVEQYPALDVEQFYILTIRASAEIGEPVERKYRLSVDGLKRLSFQEDSHS